MGSANIFANIHASGLTATHGGIPGEERRGQENRLEEKGKEEKTRKTQEREEKSREETRRAEKRRDEKRRKQKEETISICKFAGLRSLRARLPARPRWGARNGRSKWRLEPARLRWGGRNRYSGLRPARPRWSVTLAARARSASLGRSK